MKCRAKSMVVLMMVLLVACSSKFENIIFSLVPRPQEPGERSYNIKQVEFINPRDGIRLSGEITYPRFGMNFTALVLVSGTTAGEPPYARDSYITGHKYFLVISHLLTKRGYAVLRYDNRGVGKSTGEYINATDDDFSSDAAAALAWLREGSGINISSSGFLGHSQGAVKSMIAANTIDPDFIISLAGIGSETIAETMRRQSREINNANGVVQSITDQQLKELSEIFEIIRVSKDSAQARIEIRQYVLDAGITNENHIQKVVDEFGSNWWFNEAHRDITPLIKNYDGPVLALFGSKDLLVSAHVNEVPVREMLRNSESEVYTFEGLNHLFQTAKKGIGPEEYWEIETTIEESVIEKIDDWLKSLRN